MNETMPNKIHINKIMANKVDEVIDFLEEAKDHTYSSEDHYYLENAIETLYHMKACGKFKE